MVPDNLNAGTWVRVLVPLGHELEGADSDLGLGSDQVLDVEVTNLFRPLITTSKKVGTEALPDGSGVLNGWHLDVVSDGSPLVAISLSSLSFE